MSNYRRDAHNQLRYGRFVLTTAKDNASRRRASRYRSASYTPESSADHAPGGLSTTALTLPRMRPEDSGLDDAKGGEPERPYVITSVANHHHLDYHHFHHNHCDNHYNHHHLDASASPVGRGGAAAYAHARAAARAATIVAAASTRSPPSSVSGASGGSRHRRNPRSDPSTT